MKIKTIVFIVFLSFLYPRLNAQPIVKWGKEVALQSEEGAHRIFNCPDNRIGVLTNSSPLIDGIYNYQLIDSTLEVIVELDNSPLSYKHYGGIKRNLEFLNTPNRLRNLKMTDEELTKWVNEVGLPYCHNNKFFKFQYSNFSNNTLKYKFQRINPLDCSELEEYEPLIIQGEPLILNSQYSSELFFFTSDEKNVHLFYTSQLMKKMNNVIAPYEKDRANFRVTSRKIDRNGDLWLVGTNRAFFVYGEHALYTPCTLVALKIDHISGEMEEFEYDLTGYFAYYLYINFDIENKPIIYCKYSKYSQSGLGGVFKWEISRNSEENKGEFYPIDYDILKQNLSIKDKGTFEKAISSGQLIEGMDFKYSSFNASDNGEVTISFQHKDSPIQILTEPSYPKEPVYWSGAIGKLSEINDNVKDISGDLIVFRFDVDQNLKWIRKIPMYQELISKDVDKKSNSSNADFDEIKIHWIHDKMYVVYNDNIDNAELNSSDKVAKYNNNIKSCTAVSVIDSDGNITKSILYKKSEKPVIFSPNLSISNGDKLIFLGLAEGSYTPAEITFE